MSTPEITDLLSAWSVGEEEAGWELIQRVFADLRLMARRHMARERPDHTLEPTELVHEVFLRFADQDRIDWTNRHHFFGACQRIMRRVLVDHARRHRAHKRGGGAVGSIDGLEEIENRFRHGLDPDDLLALHGALERLGKIRRRQARVVELRFFVGLSIGEVAEILDMSVRTVKQDWTQARAWLFQTLNQESSHG